MRASEIISNIEKRIEIEKKTIETHDARLDMLLTILHMAKKDGYIEKKGATPTREEINRGGIKL